MEAKITLVVLIGLPGAGKSTLCKRLCQDLKSKPICSEIKMIHICFDEVIPLDLQEKIVLMKQSKLEDTENETTWKSLRRDIHCKVGRLIECLKSGTVDAEVFSLFGVSVNQGENVNYVIILDDNFYYKSMRYEYYQLARKYHVGYCQCFIECATDIAVLRNQNREVQVPTIAIQTMAENLQPPQPDEHSWEHNTAVLSSQSLNELVALWDVIYTSLESPVPPLENRDSEVAEARLKCSLSVAHQADLMMRNLVGTLIKEAKAKQSLPVDKLPKFSRTVNAGRQNILVAIKDGSLKFPAHLAVEFYEENREEMHEFLKLELHKYLECET